MIHEVDEALRTLVRREVVNGSGVEVVFDAPTREWSARRNTPTVDVYLYDIREDLRRRERGLINEYNEEGRVTERRLPPRYFKFSYLITAWTQRPEDEHRLLASVLQCFLRYEKLPDDMLTGSLRELGLEVPVTIALPPPQDRSFADVWTALGGELKPSLDIVVSAPTDTGRVYPAAAPALEPPLIKLGNDALATGIGAGHPDAVVDESSLAGRRRRLRRELRND
ncbi:Pvc16 family protein [Flindersiella endophytica]